MVFLAKSSSPAEWKTVLAAISALVEEATFEATGEALNFRAMDPSHVALVDLQWPNTGFEKYDCDRQFRFTIRVDEFVKLIKRAESKDSIEISADEEKLILRIYDGYKREFRLHLLESTAAPTPLPKISFNARLVVVEDVFERILNDISVLADHVTLEATKDGVQFYGKDEAGEASISLDRGNPDLIELEVKEESKATYSLEYLLDITKAAGSASDVISCEYSSKMPLRLEFKLGQTGGRIHFYLAPRVEER